MVCGAVNARSEREPGRASARFGSAVRKALHNAKHRCEAGLQCVLGSPSAESSTRATAQPRARRRLSHVLDLYQAKRRSVAGDGNCQFRALSLQLHDSEDCHRAVRQCVVEQLKTRPDLYAPFVEGAYDRYIARMARNTEWGDHITLQAACDALGCEIHVLTDQPGAECLSLSPTTCDEPTRRPVCLALQTDLHYDAAYLK
mmetsp:Transcript_22342/g.61927  ORF Transcript_22342/g.61927 Transcript_22342/m.61927 type:complete len:201 (-) Transcript_22342:376-978(-)